MFSPFLALFVVSAFLLPENVSPLANLWEVTHPERAKPSYFYGTFHISWKLIFDKMPLELLNVVQSADVAVFEADSGSIPEVMELLKCQTQRNHPDLSPDLNARLKKTFDLLQVMALFQMPADWLVLSAQTLITQKWQEAARKGGLRPNPTSLDDKLKKMAKRGGKEVRFVERAMEMCEVDPGMDSEKASILLNNELEVEERCRAKGINPIWTMIEQYKKGQIQRMMNNEEKGPCGIVITPKQKLALERAGKTLFHNMLVGRNLKWGPKMDEWMLMEPNKTFVFFFGAAHFNSGPQSINLVQMLTKRGYRIRQINSTEGGGQVTNARRPVIDKPEDDYDEPIGLDQLLAANNSGKKHSSDQQEEGNNANTNTNHSSRPFSWPCVFVLLVLFSIFSQKIF